MSQIPSTDATTAPWRLAPGVHGVVIGEDLVLLDVAADAYFCLAGAARVIALDGQGGVQVQDEAARDTLAEAGLIGQGGQAEAVGVLPRPMVGVPRRGTGGVTDGRTIGRIIRAGCMTALDFRRRRFEGLLAWGRGRPVADRRRFEPPSPALLETAAAFERLRVWFPFDGACLQRSSMMLRYLRLCGHDAAWVIGVRTWPFMAHCWLQVGETALDDDPERLLPYQPILVI